MHVSSEVAPLRNESSGGRGFQSRLRKAKMRRLQNVVLIRGRNALESRTSARASGSSAVAAESHQPSSSSHKTYVPQPVSEKPALSTCYLCNTCPGPVWV